MGVNPGAIHVGCISVRMRVYNCIDRIMIELYSIFI